MPVIALLIKVGDKMKELSNIEQKSNEVQIPVGPIYLNGNLEIPKGSRGIVIFAQGRGVKA